MATRIDTVEARSRLKVRSAPYWQRLTAGRHIGFRRMSTTTDGTWQCQSYDPEDSKQTRRSLGDFAHLPPSQRYDAAKSEAELWFKHLDLGGKLSAAITVRTACANYVEHLRSLGKGKTADDVRRRFAQYVNDKPLGQVELQRLKPRDIDVWRKSLAATMATPQHRTKAPTRPRSPSTLNRDMTPLRAALNLALADGHVTTDAAWKAKMRPLKDADRRRDVYLDLTQRRALIVKAPADLAVFLSALSLVPLRPGAMAALVAGNFDKRLSTLTIGNDKHGQDRKITLPPATAAFFAEQCKGKLPTAPLLSRADGSTWNKDAWKYPIKDAVIAAELPAAATAYALRHSTITDLIALHKLDTLTVAQLSGTSLLMIEKHYGHLLREHAAKALASLTL